VQSRNGIEDELSAHVGRVKRKTRPWKSIIALVLAIAAAVISHRAADAARHDSYFLFTARHMANQFVAVGTALLFLVFGSIATYSLAGKARELFEPRIGTAHSAIISYAILILGGFTTLLITLVLFGIPVSQLVLGGALTTVFISIAAQQALGNVFAGLVLLFARPFKVGDEIRLRAGALGGTLDGVVTDIGVTYVRFRSGGNVMSIPNSQVLNAVVGPVPRDGDNDAPVAGDGRSGTPGSPEQPQPSPPGPA
jgi:small-conductance mechanosensitive channel